MLHRYVDPKLDRLQLYTLTVTCVSIFYGIMLDNDKIQMADPRETSVQSVMLTGMNIAVIVSIPMQFFIDQTIFDFIKEKLFVAFGCCCRQGDADVGADAKAANRTSIKSCQPRLFRATALLLRLLFCIPTHCSTYCRTCCRDYCCADCYTPIAMPTAAPAAMPTAVPTALATTMVAGCGYCCGIGMIRSS